MSQEDLDALLNRMPSIAEAVNKFTSETIQQEAFKALIAAYGGSSRLQETAPPHISTPQEAAPAEYQSPPPASSGKPRRQRKGNGGSAKESFTFLRHIDIQPSGGTALKDLIAEKNHLAMRLNLLSLRIGSKIMAELPRSQRITSAQHSGCSKSANLPILPPPFESLPADTGRSMCLPIQPSA